jgi:hypothetical protein
MISFGRLLTAIVILFVIVAMASGGLVMAARQSEPQSWAIFRAPDGTPCEGPCVFGVMPGQTSLAEAENLLNHHGYTRDLMLNNQTEGHRQYMTPDDTLIVTLRMDEQNVITWISTGFEENVLSYGDSLALLGEPELVRFAARDGGGFLSLRYDGNLVISSYQQSNSFYPNQRVGGIELSSQPIQRGLTNRFDFVQFTVNEFPFWQGFGSIMRYVAHPQCRRPGGEGLRVCHL